MKLGQLISHYKIETFIKKLYKNCDVRTSSSPFGASKELRTTSFGKWNFWSKRLILDMQWQNYWNLCNQYADLLIFLFSEDCLKMKKDLELVSRSYFTYNFFDKQFFFCNITWTDQISILSLISIQTKFQYSQNFSHWEAS